MKTRFCPQEYNFRPVFEADSRAVLRGNHPILALILSGVQGGIRPPDCILGRLVFLFHHSQADARRDDNVLARDAAQLCPKTSMQMLNNPLRLFKHGVGQRHHKLIAPKTAHRIGLSKFGTANIGRRLDDRVACMMALCVIDFLRLSRSKMNTEVGMEYFTQESYC